MASASASPTGRGLFPRSRVWFMASFARRGSKSRGMPIAPRVCGSPLASTSRPARRRRRPPAPGPAASEIGERRGRQFGIGPGRDDGVEAQDVRQHQGVREAMRNVEMPAERVGQRMHGRDGRIGEGLSRQHRPEQHVGTRLPVSSRRCTAAQDRAAHQASAPASPACARPDCCWPTPRHRPRWHAPWRRCPWPP